MIWWNKDIYLGGKTVYCIVYTAAKVAGYTPIWLPKDGHPSQYKLGPRFRVPNLGPSSRNVADND